MKIKEREGLRSFLSPVTWLALLDWLPTQARSPSSAQGLSKAPLDMAAC